MTRRWPLSLLLLFLAIGVAAESPHKEVVAFSHTANVGVGNSVFVVGNHPDLGSWDVAKAVKLRHTPGDVWTGEIAVQAGTQLQYKYIRRGTDRLVWCNATNAVDLSGVLSRTVAAQPAAPYHGKTIYYLSGWSAANLYYNIGGENWTTAPMERIGSGRAAGESLYKVSGIPSAGEELVFVFNNGAGSWDNPPGGGNYRTAIDIFQVQDGNVYAYRPPPTVSAPQLTTHFINSTATNIPGRNIRVYVPRGYAQNTTRRYPVLYLHDGQNVFPPQVGVGTWNADSIATREIGQGRMREAILVGVNHGGDSRIAEYQPPSDSYNGTQGRADAYAHFLIHNVRPFVDANFRTLNDPANTLTLGSSMGGLVSLYLGREFTTFGKIGVVSPALWIAPNYVNTVAAGTKKPLRVYLDFGTQEGSTSTSWNDALRMHDIHLSQQYAMNSDFWFVVGCGHGHTEAAWEIRLPAMYHYLLPAREEPAELAQQEIASRLSTGGINVLERSATFSFPTLYGFRYSLRRSGDLAGWTDVDLTPTEQLPWSTRTLSDVQFPQGDRFFWRVEATPAP